MGNNLTAPPTEAQAKAVSIVRTVVSVPALLGAGYIVQNVLRSKARRQLTCPRILLGMSSMDFILGVTTFASTWPIPEGIRAYSVGTWTSCEVFGFLYQGSRLSSVLYNASLALYYILTIRYDWREGAFGKRTIQWPLHLVPLAVGWGTAVACLPLGLYNPALFGCTIASYPPPCKRGTVPCQRGADFEVYSYAFFFIPLWLVFLFLVVSMGLIYDQIRRNEARSNAYGSSQFQSARFAPSGDFTIDHNNNNNGGAATAVDNASDDRTIGHTIIINTAGAAAPDSAVNDTDAFCEETSGQPPRFVDGGDTKAAPLELEIAEAAASRVATTPPTTAVGSRRPTLSARSIRSKQRKQNKLSHQFAVQAFLYCTAFIITWLFSTVQVLLIQFQDGIVYMPMVFLVVIFGSLQGFWNAVIYIRPRYLRYRRQQKRTQETTNYFTAASGQQQASSMDAMPD